MKFRLIEDQRDTFPVCAMCDVLGVSPARYYAWRSRPESHRKAVNLALLAEIRRVHAAHRGRYGAPRVHATLRAEGHTASRSRVERLMRHHGIRPRNVATVSGAHHGQPSRLAGRAEFARTDLRGHGLIRSSLHAMHARLCCTLSQRQVALHQNTGDVAQVGDSVICSTEPTGKFRSRDTRQQIAKLDPHRRISSVIVSTRIVSSIVFIGRANRGLVTVAKATEAAAASRATTKRRSASHLQLLPGLGLPLAPLAGSSLPIAIAGLGFPLQ